MKVSLIIAIQDDGLIFFDLLNSLKNQKSPPDEIIIVDSSIKKNYSFAIKERLKKTSIKNKYLKIKKSFQGKSLNEGIKISTWEYICFLDTKTIPNENWLIDYKKLITKNNIDIVWGSTNFEVKTKFQSLYKAATYGSVEHKTVPGSLMKSNIFSDKKFFFNEKLRSSFDLEWKDKINRNFKNFFPKKKYINYSYLPSNLFALIKRHSIYAFYTAIGNSQNNIKDFYLALFLILSALIVPKWNYIIEGWDNNILYIPNITKIYLLSLILIALIYFLLKKIRILKNNFFFEFSIKLAIFIFISFGVYKWNASVAKWVEESVFYFPHITKIYISTVLIIIIIFRGILRPILRKEKLSFLLPFNWIMIGFIGLLIDLTKMPFFIIGSLYSNIKHLIFFKKNN